MLTIGQRIIGRLRRFILSPRADELDDLQLRNGESTTTIGVMPLRYIQAGERLMQEERTKQCDH